MLIFLAAPIFVSAATPDFTITASASSATIPPGSSASYAVQLASVNGFAGPVNLIPSVSSQPQGVAVNAKMNRVYVADWQSNSLTVIDGSTDKIIASIPVVQRPEGVAVNPSTNRTYVTGIGGVSVIDDATNTLVYTISAPSSLAITVNPVTNKIYTAAGTAATVIDGSTNTIVGTVTVGFVPTGIGVNPVTNRIYVGSQNTNDVTVIDGSTDAVVATISVPFMPALFGVDVNPETNRIYVANDGPVSVIDGSTNAVIANIPVTGTFTALAVNAALNEVYVSDQLSYFGGPPPADKLVIINATSNTQIANVTVGAVPSGIGINQISGRIYVDNENSDTMSVIDTSTLTLVDTIILDPTISATPSIVTLSSGGTGTSTVTVATYTNTRLGTYYFYLYANSSVGVHFITLTLFVGDFALVPASSSLSVPRGSNASAVITVDSLSGYWNVNITAAIEGQNLNIGVSPSTVSIGPSVSGVSTITVDMSSLNSISNYTLTISGTSGTWSHSASILVRVTDFSISASPPGLTIQPGSSASLLITASSINGFSGPTSLAVVSAPAGLSCNLNVTSIILTASAYSQLTCAGLAGNYTVVVTGTSRPLVHSIVIPVNVSQASGGGGQPPGGAAGESGIYVAVILADIGVIAVSAIYAVRLRRKPVQA